jgi:hypothetical protein
MAVWEPCRSQCWFKTFKPFNRYAPFKPVFRNLFPAHAGKIKKGLNDLNCLNDLNSLAT